MKRTLGKRSARSIGEKSGGPISASRVVLSLATAGQCLLFKLTRSNLSRIQTTVVAAITTNLDLAKAPGNVVLPARSAGLARDSVVNVSQLLTLDRGFLTEHAGALPPRLQRFVDEGLRTVLQL